MPLFRHQLQQAPLFKKMSSQTSVPPFALFIPLFRAPHFLSLSVTERQLKRPQHVARHLPRRRTEKHE